MLERLSEGTREEWIAVVNEVAAPKQKSVFAVRPIASDLMHPDSARTFPRKADRKKSPG